MRRLLLAALLVPAVVGPSDAAGRGWRGRLDAAAIGEGTFGPGTYTSSGTFVVRSTGGASGTRLLQIVGASGASLLSVQEDGYLGIGTIAPDLEIHIRRTIDGDRVGVQIDNDSDTSSSDAAVRVKVAGASANDPYLLFQVGTSTRDWIMGIDNSVSLDPFVISMGSALGTNNRVVIDSNGESSIGGNADSTPDAGLEIVPSSVPVYGLLVSSQNATGIIMGVQTDGDVGIGVAPTLGMLHIDRGTGVGQVTFDGSTGGCIMLRDTDDAGWTECDALDGTLSCSVDADGLCD